MQHKPQFHPVRGRYRRPRAIRRRRFASSSVAGRRRSKRNFQILRFARHLETKKRVRALAHGLSDVFRRLAVDEIDGGTRRAPRASWLCFRAKTYETVSPSFRDISRPFAPNRDARATKKIFIVIVDVRETRRARASACGAVKWSTLVPRCVRKHMHHCLPTRARVSVRTAIPQTTPLDVARRARDDDGERKRTRAFFDSSTRVRPTTRARKPRSCDRTLGASKSRIGVIGTNARCAE